MSMELHDKNTMPSGILYVRGVMYGDHVCGGGRGKGVRFRVCRGLGEGGKKQIMSHTTGYEKKQFQKNKLTTIR